MPFDASELPNGPLRDFYDYCCGLSEDGAVAAWTSFDPVAIPALVPHLTIFDVDLKSVRVSIRFVGTEIVAAQGRDTTGAFLDELENMETVEKRCLEAARHGMPYFLTDLPVTWTSNDFKTYTTLGIPLADDGDRAKVVYLMIFN